MTSTTTPQHAQNAASTEWVPVHEAHAIEQTAFVVQFEKEVDNDKIQEIAKIAHEKFHTKFAKRGPLNFIVGFNLSAVGAIPPPPINAGSYAFQNFQNDGSLLSELRFDKSSFAFRTLKYTRWADVWGEAKNYFSELLPLYIASVPLLTLGLQYTNKFIWKDSSSPISMAKLLRTGSPYIAQHIFETKDLWHSHTGAFLKPDSHRKRLLTVNLDFIDEPDITGPLRGVRIHTSIMDAFNQQGYDSTTLTSNSVSDTCSSRMEEFHDYNKTVFSKIISDEMIARLDLWAP